MVKIVIEAGHGGYKSLNPKVYATAGKRTPDGEPEWIFNNKVVLAAIAKLNTYEGVQILRVDDPTGKTDVPLATRTNRANSWGADVYVSCHHNAFQGVWGTHTGTDTFTMDHPNANTKSVEIARVVHPLVVKAMGLRDRGMKKANFHVLRETKMPAILIEGGFMDSSIDIKVMRNDAKLKAQGEAIAEGLAIYFKLKPKNNIAPIKPSQPVQPSIAAIKYGDTGSAVGKLQSDLNKVGYKLVVDNSFGPAVLVAVRDFQAKHKLIVDGIAGPETLAKLDEVIKPAPTEMYRVRKTWADVKSQIGAYTILQNAKDLADKNKGYSVFNNTGTNIYTPKIETPTPQPPNPPKINNPIMGKSQSKVEQMIAFVENINPNAEDLEDIALSFLEVGDKYGIRGDVAYCQSIIETGWFRFDGGTAVTPDQHNYCGLGVVSKGIKGHSFKTVKEGVTAQIQHLYAYASKDELPIGEVLVDPRYKYVTRGIAPGWEDLSNRWAMNPNYGKQILSIYDNLLKYPIPETNIDDLVEAFNWAMRDKEAQKIILDLWKRR